MVFKARLTQAKSLTNEKRLEQALSKLFQRVKKEVLDSLEEYWTDYQMRQGQIDMVCAPIHAAHREYMEILEKHIKRERSLGRAEAKRLVKLANKNRAAFKEANTIPIKGILDKDELFGTSKYAEDKLLNHTFQASEKTMQRIDNDINKIISDGYRSGKGIDPVSRDIIKRFDQIADWEARRIARTEIHNAHQNSIMQTYEEMGVEYTQWSSVNDGRTRGSRPKDKADHIVLNGEIIKFGGKYSNGLEYPGDTNGRLVEWINCRCSHAPFVMPPGKAAPPGMAQFRVEDLISIEAPDYDELIRKAIADLEGKTPKPKEPVWSDNPSVYLTDPNSFDLTPSEKAELERINNKQGELTYEESRFKDRARLLGEMGDYVKKLNKGQGLDDLEIEDFIEIFEYVFEMTPRLTPKSMAILHRGVIHKGKPSEPKVAEPKSKPEPVKPKPKPEPVKPKQKIEPKPEPKSRLDELTAKTEIKPIPEKYYAKEGMSDYDRLTHIPKHDNLTDLEIAYKNVQLGDIKLSRSETETAELIKECEDAYISNVEAEIYHLRHITEQERGLMRAFEEINPKRAIEIRKQYVKKQDINRLTAAEQKELNSLRDVKQNYPEDWAKDKHRHYEERLKQLEDRINNVNIHAVKITDTTQRYRSMGYSIKDEDCTSYHFADSEVNIRISEEIRSSGLSLDFVLSTIKEQPSFTSDTYKKIVISNQDIVTSRSGMLVGGFSDTKGTVYSFTGNRTRFKSTLAHEGAHNTEEGVYQFSSNPDFQLSVREDVKLRKEDKIKKTPLPVRNKKEGNKRNRRLNPQASDKIWISKYAEDMRTESNNEFVEAFADSYAAYVREPEWFRKNYPNTCKYFDTVIKKYEKTGKYDPYL